MAVTAISTRVDLPLPHSEGQRHMILNPGNGVAFCGRRWGKTLVGVERILIFAFQDPGLYWWVGLSWKSASMKRAWRLLKHFTRKIYKAAGLDIKGKIREVDKEVHLPNGAAIWLRTAENPEAMAGEGVKGIVGDEFSLWAEVIWTEYLQATLLDYEGWILFIGVPKGNNWATKLWRMAAVNDNWKQYHFTSYDNPGMSRNRLEEIKSEAPSAIFDQEYLAKIRDDGGVVFRNVRACIDKRLNNATHDGAIHYGGLDWAQLNDFTVITIVNNRGEVVSVDRFNQIGWEIQYDRVRTATRKWKLTGGYAETNSIGSPNLEQLNKTIKQWFGFETTNTSKNEIIQALILAFEQEKIAIPDDPVLIAELESFEANRLPSGRWRYSAPDGMHDDTVIALALGWWAYINQLAEIKGGSFRYA